MRFRIRNLLHRADQKIWWWGEDSNLRRLCRQIYSLFPLAAREPHQNHKLYNTSAWSQRRDSNPRPTDYKSVALPTELRWRWQAKARYFMIAIATCAIPDNLSSVNMVYEKTGQTIQDKPLLMPRSVNVFMPDIKSKYVTN
jgi:hypothetical protein